MNYRFGRKRDASSNQHEQALEIKHCKRIKKEKREKPTRMKTQKGSLGKSYGKETPLG